ncbi:plant dual-specificity MAP kinase kinase family domain protein (macronuclear) [Tetrahymena thermophila SB210]|uniref:non-specific serine/threonine protein kinase n=1 Tax=Tetrahymena thermophila (strain SB210) TaxID=312017 RepID=Q23DQ8_TETTS|nr:plant dual-specificity MAP kinase kinase family domain protein [Tetrahymena thermophila SB210]EAR94643.2 plant dual-specificity MAP kinase kinase family domain protein [Tetrahymena thermophila SB210]|eukprot:XP_001014628.2 plant dual-specificity MAP kinase kinase family domain protein [Tetrahymena thermophila SB210]
MDNYIKIELVGKGNFGLAVLVQSKINRKYYIMKIIDILRLDQRQRQDALNEVKFLKELGHPFIIAYRESFVDKDRYLCIVMDYCEEGDLYNQIIEQKKTGQGFTEQQILEWFVQICFGLKFIHDRRILHRDLKTQNIFLTKSKQIKIGDFGIAKVLQNTCEMAKTAIGTPYYLSPEICQQKPYNQKTDIWSLGCILYELCTLRHAFDAKHQQGLVLKILKGNYPSIPNCYSPQLSDLIGEMLQRHPAKRPSVKKILEKQFLANTINKILANMVQQSSNRKGTSSQNDVQVIQQLAEGIQSNNIERQITKNDENQAPLAKQQQEQQKSNIQNSNQQPQSLNSSFLRQLYQHQNQIQNPQQQQQIASNCDSIIQQQKLQYLQNQQEYKEKQGVQNQISYSQSAIKQNGEEFRTPIQEKKINNLYGSSSSDQQQSTTLAEIKSQFPSFQMNGGVGQQQANQISLNLGNQQIQMKNNIQGNQANINNIQLINKNENQILQNNGVRQSSLTRQDNINPYQNYKNIQSIQNPLRRSFDGSQDNSIYQNQKSTSPLLQNQNNSNNKIVSPLYHKSSNKIINPQQNNVYTSIPPLANQNQAVRSSIEHLSNPLLPSLSSSSISSSRKQQGNSGSLANIPLPNQNHQKNSLSQIPNFSLPQIQQQQSDQQIQKQRSNSINSILSNQKKQFNNTQQSDSDEDFEEPEDQRVKCEFLGVDGIQIPGMSEKDSIFNRIEALKVYLERNLGEDLFIQIYQEIQLQDQNLSETDQTKRINSILNVDQQKFIPLIYQMIFCEDSYYTNS